MEKIKSVNTNDYNGKTSYAIETESGKKALVTAGNLAKYGGKVETLKAGDEVNVVFEEVQKKTGGGSWTSAHFPDWEVKQNTGGGSGGGGWTPKAGGSYKGEDVVGKIVNTSLMSAVTVFTSSPAGTKSVEELFDGFVHIALAKYNSVKQ